MLGVPLQSAKPGLIGKPVTSNIRFIDRPKPARNVIAILPGSDPKLSGEDVAIGAHNDRSGIDRGPHMRLFPWLNSLPGRLALRCALRTQNAFLTHDLGNGYIIRARRR